MPIRTIDLDSGFTIPYNPQLYLGRGVKVLEGKAAFKSPFKRSSIALQPLSQVASSASFKFDFVRDKKELDRTVEATVDASATLSTIPVSANTKYLSKVQVSDTKMVTLLQASFEPEMQRLAKEPVFTAEADALLARDPEEFARVYGDYYVSGFTCRSTMTAVAQHTAQSKSDLDQFTAHVQVGMAASEGEAETATYEPLEDAPEPEGEQPEAAEGETADKKPVKGTEMSSALKNKETASSLLKFENPVKASVAVGTSVSSQTKDDHVTTSITIFKTGVKGVGSVAHSIDEVLTLYQNWAEYIAPIPVIVHLEHYKTIDNRCLSPGENLLKGRSAPVSKAMKRIYRLYNDVLSSPYPEIRDRKDALNELVDQLSELEPLEENYVAQFEAWTSKLSSQEFDIKRMQVRRKFVKLVLGLTDNNWGRDRCYNWSHKGASHDGIDSYGITKHSPGLFDGEFAFVLSEIDTTPASYSANAGFGCVGNVIDVHTDGMRFIGFDVIDYWRDGSNGGYELQNIDPDNEIKIRVESQGFRGCNWGLMGYRVSRHLYHFDQFN